MVDRGLPIVDGAPACPFVAFEDDRDERATAPDHRHRCYAEPRPAPRALAHQDAYCLSSNFPVCPTFQDWARREAAAARPAAAGRSEHTTEAELPPERHPLPPPDREARHAPGTSMPPRRNPPRDWAAPPPWSGAPGGRAGPGEDEQAPRARARDHAPPEARGLAGSAADRFLVGGSFDGERDRGDEPGDGWADPAPDDGQRRPFEPVREDAPMRPATDREPVMDPPGRPDRPGAEPGRGARWTERDTIGRRSEGWTDPDADEDDEASAPAPPRPSSRGSVDRTRDRGGRFDPGRRDRGDRGDRGDDPRRPIEGPELVGPAWERPRRYEAYPSLRSRVALPMPRMSRLLVALAALGIGVIVFFALPGLLGVGSDDRPSTSPSRSVSASPTVPPSPTPPPEPTPQVYVVASGDTLSRIAQRFGLTLDQILDANPQIDDPDEIAVGDPITIPVPSDDGEGTESAEPSAT